MEAVKAKNKTFKKLGFTYLETAEIVVSLNTLLANYQVFYNKLRNFHWNIEGPEFFELHEEFECQQAWDDVTGMPLKPKLVEEARKEEIVWVRKEGVYRKIRREEAVRRDLLAEIICSRPLG